MKKRHESSINWLGIIQILMLCTVILILVIPGKSVDKITEHHETLFLRHTFDISTNEINKVILSFEKKTDTTFTIRALLFDKNKQGEYMLVYPINTKRPGEWDGNVLLGNKKQWKQSY